MAKRKSEPWTGYDPSSSVAIGVASRRDERVPSETRYPTFRRKKAVLSAAVRKLNSLPSMSIVPRNVVKRRITVWSACLSLLPCVSVACSEASTNDDVEIPHASAAGEEGGVDRPTDGDAGSGPRSDGDSDAGADANRPPDPAAAQAALEAIGALAGASECSDYSWKNRGQAPIGYVKGLALVFARAVCHPTRSDVLVVSEAATDDSDTDALAHYGSVFSDLGMSNTVAGEEPLRHVYTLLMGLGMRESSGQHCVGRDRGSSNVSADSAEAGAWQTSWDSRHASSELPKLFARYRSDPAGCLLDTFAEDVSCDADDWANWGAGEGRDFQELEKACPAFAAEYAAVMLRVSGGATGHYGPLRRKEAEVRAVCDEMLREVQELVHETPDVCSVL